MKSKSKIRQGQSSTRVWLQRAKNITTCCLETVPGRIVGPGALGMRAGRDRSWALLVHLVYADNDTMGWRVEIELLDGPLF